MNNKAKRRLMVTGGIVVIAMLVIVAIAGAGGSVPSLSIADVANGAYADKKVQVTGSVAADSITTNGSTVEFAIVSEDDPDGARLQVAYDGALPATFGTGVVAICTGTMMDPPALACTEMVTKCPSKYESAEGSLTVKTLVDQAQAMVGVETKVCGYVRGDVNDASAGHRFVIESQGAEIPVVYDGGLDEAIVDGAAVVVSGSLTEDGSFVASEQPAIDTSIKE